MSYESSNDEWEETKQCHVCGTDTDEYDTCDICHHNFCWDICCNRMTEEKDTKYCEKCVPESVVEENKRYEEELRLAEQEYTRILSTKKERRKKLLKELHRAGLELRSDSKLCKNHIEYDIEDVHTVVRRMCEMKYLFEYCDMRKELSKVEDEHIKILDAGYIPDGHVFDEAEYNVLKRVGGYPKIFPWLKNDVTRP